MTRGPLIVVRARGSEGGVEDRAGSSSIKLKLERPGIFTAGYAWDTRGGDEWLLFRSDGDVALVSDDSSQRV